MSISEKGFVVPLAAGHRDLLKYFEQATADNIDADRVPVRFVVTGFDREGYRCEVGTADRSYWEGQTVSSAFKFVRRSGESAGSFNVVFIVPTGIGAEIGGHAGDATPAAHLLASSCDRLILHPNVVNASDINEAPPNSLYLEGSEITRLLMGTIGIQEVRANRILVVVDGAHNKLFFGATVNSVNAAVSSYGIRCAGVWALDSAPRMTSKTSISGRIGGLIENMSPLFRLLKRHRNEYDAISVSSPIFSPSGVLTYFTAGGSMANPWGGVEALLTHTITSVLNVPSAHSPMMESEDIAKADLGIVDPRMAAEAVSLTFVNCVLKGLRKSPKIVHGADLYARPGMLTAADVSCLVIPNGCLGLPTLAALEQGIPVIAVVENKNMMRNDLTQLPWQPGQFWIAQNYWEASGIASAIKAGLNPDSTRRPLARVSVRRD